jgi:3',5'-cyclic AMP phosphodiesterase CpdA
VVEAVQKAEPDFIVHTGDLVADGSDTTHWPFFFSIERELLRKAAFFPSLGNHERNHPQFYDFFQVKTPYYSFDWGQAHFTILNSDIGNAALSRAAREAFWTEQTRWLVVVQQARKLAAFFHVNVGLFL